MMSDDVLKNPETLFKRCSALATMSLIDDSDTHELKETPEGLVYMFYNGGGDEVRIAFSAAGCLIIGFDHESECSPYDDDPIRKEVYDQLPETLHNIVLSPKLLGPTKDDDAFSGQLGKTEVKEALLPVTFALWWEAQSTDWGQGEAHDEDGSDWLLERALEDWDMDFEDFEEHIEHFFGHEPLSEALLKELDSGLKFSELQKKLPGLGYGESYPYT